MLDKSADATGLARPYDAVALVLADATAPPAVEEVRDEAAAVAMFISEHDDSDIVGEATVRMIESWRRRRRALLLTVAATMAAVGGGAAAAASGQLPLAQDAVAEALDRVGVSIPRSDGGGAGDGKDPASTNGSPTSSTNSPSAEQPAQVDGAPCASSATRCSDADSGGGASHPKDDAGDAPPSGPQHARPATSAPGSQQQPPAIGGSPAAGGPAAGGTSNGGATGGGNPSAGNPGNSGGQAGSPPGNPGGQTGGSAPDPPPDTGTGNGNGNGPPGGSPPGQVDGNANGNSNGNGNGNANGQGNGNASGNGNANGQDHSNVPGPDTEKHKP